MSYTENPITPNNDRRDGWLIAVTCFAAVCMVAAIVAAAYASRVKSSAPATTGPQTVTFDLVLTEFKVTPASIEVPAGDMVHVRVTNNGTMQHDLQWSGTTGTPMIDPGKTVEADFGVINADGQAWCTVPGHKQLGMVLDVTVIPAGGAATKGATTTSTPVAALTSGATAATTTTHAMATTTKATPTTTTMATTSTAAVTTSAAPKTVTFDVSLSEFKVTPSTIEVPAGSDVRVRVKNDGTVQHDLQWNGTTGTPMIDPGQTAEADFGVINADGQAWCTVPGHKQLGMVLNVKVTPAGSSTNSKS